MKTLRIIFFVLVLSSQVLAAEDIPVAREKESSVMRGPDLRLVLNSFMALAEGQIESTLRDLKLLSVTEEIRSGQWDAMKGLLSEFGNRSIPGTAVWFVRPDGSYFVAGKGPMEQNLSDRPYFQELMRGGDVVGDLIISRATGKRSAVVAVPVKRDGQVIGGLGVSLSLEEMSGIVDKKMALPADLVFYALDKKGQTSLHRSSLLLFAFPSDMGSRTLREAVKEMLSKSEGETRYDFFGQRAVAFKKSSLTGWVFAVGMFAGAQAGAPSSGLPPILSELEREFTVLFTRIDADLAAASKDLSRTGLTGPDARNIISSLCRSTPYAVDCATVGREGRMLIVQPAEYRKFEGSDISMQEQVVRLRESKRPVMSRVFRAVEGFDAIDFEYPVFSHGSEFLGSVSILIRTDSLFSDFVSPIVHGLPVEVWILQRDGRIVFDPDADEIGRMLFDDPMYRPFPELLALGKKVVREGSGSGSYEFLGKGLKEPVKKDAYWKTVGLYGTEWRLVVSHTVKDEGRSKGEGTPSAALQLYDQKLRDLAAGTELTDALSDGKREKVQAIFKKFYRDHAGLYAIQWVAVPGINRYGYPEENTVLDFDFRSGKAPSSKFILKALSEKRESSFDAPLIEGKEGRFFMVPVYKGDQLLGMLYTIILKR